MIELIAARGNTSLESAVSLAKSIRWDIQSLGVKLKSAVEDSPSRNSKSKSVASAQAQSELRLVISGVRNLLERIEDAVPLINLAITTSGVSLSTNLPASISPSRLLQASTLLTAGDTRYAIDPSVVVPIGPAFNVSMYMLFVGHAHPTHAEDQLRATTWKEVMHKAKLKLVRVPLDLVNSFPFSASNAQESKHLSASTPSDQSTHQMSGQKPVDEYAYQLVIIEDLDDDRVHDFSIEEPQPGRVDDVDQAGIREAVPIHQISKIFYADTGKILNIGSEGETNNPILLLKRDINAAPPRRMMDREDTQVWDDEEISDDESGASHDIATPKSYSAVSESHLQQNAAHRRWILPPDLDPEWIALEVYNDDIEFDSESDTVADESDLDKSETVDQNLTSSLSRLDLASSHPSSPNVHQTTNGLAMTPHQNTPLFATPGPVKTSLSLLEMLVRLTSLQQFQQTSHLAITDELLNFFLEESSTTGAPSGDTEARKQIRKDARERVGFDPYDESPVKRRGEEYQRQQDSNWDTQAEPDWDGISHVSSTRASAQSPRSSHLSRSREHSSRSRSGTPIRARNDGPPISAGRQDLSALATPPGTTKSRKAFLRDEEARERGPRSLRSSPLQKNELRE